MRFSYRCSRRCMRSRLPCFIRLGQAWLLWRGWLYSLYRLRLCSLHRHSGRNGFGLPCSASFRLRRQGLGLPGGLLRRGWLLRWLCGCFGLQMRRRRYRRFGCAFCNLGGLLRGIQGWFLLGCGRGVLHGMQDLADFFLEKTEHGRGNSSKECGNTPPASITARKVTRGVTIAAITAPADWPYCLWSSI